MSFFFLAVSGHAQAQEMLPPIDAHRFDVKPIQRSGSGRIYLFQAEQAIPKTGNLILIYDHDKPAMAFRILKNDPQQRTFVGKRVRRYDQTSELKLDESYSSLEKLADALPGPNTSRPPLTARPQTPIGDDAQLDEPMNPQDPMVGTEASADLNDAPPKRSTPKLQDPNLDETPPDDLDQLDATEENEALDEESIEFEENVSMDPYENMASVSAGYLANASNFSGSSVFNNGFSLSYAHKLFRDVFIMRKSPQDSVYLELGLIYYRIINKDGNNDLYSMLPFYGNLLYQLHASESFSFSAYVGIQYNYMTSATNPGASLSSLQGFQPNFGIGGIFAMGPQWFLRADLGWDRITGGLGIKW